MNSVNSQGKPKNDSEAGSEDGKQVQSSGYLAWVKLLVSSTAIIGSLIYAVGYLCQFGHQKMLGISQIEHVTDAVIYDGVMFFLLSPFCMLPSLIKSYLFRLVLLFLLVMLLLLIKRKSVKSRSNNSHIQNWFFRPFKITIFVILHVIFFLLAAVIFSQMDILLADPPVHTKVFGAVLFTKITSHSAQLSELLQGEDCRSLYGILFLLFVACCFSWVRLIVWLVDRSDPEGKKEQGKYVRHLLLLVSVFFIILLLVVQTMFYGFLIKQNKYPIIRLEDTVHQSFPDNLTGDDLFVLGHHKSRTLLYSAKNHKIWWVSDSHYLPASRSKPAQKLFGRPENGERVQKK